MAKYHVNLETGQPGRCHATKKCPFGDLEIDHFDSKEEARAAYEQIMSSETFAKKVKEQARVIAGGKESAQYAKGGYFTPDVVRKAAINLINQMPELAPLKSTIVHGPERARYADSYVRASERRLANAIDAMSVPAEKHIALRTIDAVKTARLANLKTGDNLSEYIGGPAQTPSAQALAAVRQIRSSAPRIFHASGFKI